MKGLWHAIIEHFEVSLLVFLFVFGTVMLAVFPMREEMARWIEGGMITGAVVALVKGKYPGTGTPGEPPKPPEGGAQ